MKLLLFIPLILGMSACSVYFEPEFDQNPDKFIYYVVDGDTFIITQGEYVRLIGVDAPEKGEENYHEASDFLKKFEGKKVVLESEGQDRDRYGRLLRHAYVDNQSLSVLLLEKGYATTYESYAGRYSKEFSNASKN